MPDLWNTPPDSSAEVEFIQFRGEDFREIEEYSVSHDLFKAIKAVSIYINRGLLSNVNGGHYDQIKYFWEVNGLFEATQSAWERKKHGIGKSLID